jgi:hypothetical protein
MATFFGVPQDDFTLTSGKPKSFHYVAALGELASAQFEPDLAAMVLDSLGLTIADAYDLEHLHLATDEAP